MRILFLNPEQYVPWDQEPSNFELRLPLLNCGFDIVHQDVNYQRILRERGREALRQEVLLAIEAFRPDLVVNSTAWPHESIDAGILMAMGNLGVRVYTQMWDTGVEPQPHEWEWFNHSTYFGLWDSVTNFRRYLAQAVGHPRVKEVIFPLGHNVFTDVIHPKPMAKHHAVSLVGSLEGARKTLVEFLNEKLERHGIRLSKVGGLVNSGVGTPECGLTDGWVPYDAYVDFINQSKIGLSSQTQNHRVQIKGKVFHYLACGVMCLSDWNAELAQIVPADCLVFYEDPDDCVKKILYYLDHDQERETIAQRGHAWFQRNYDYKRYWKGFLSRVYREVRPGHSVAVGEPCGEVVPRRDPPQKEKTMAELNFVTKEASEPDLEALGRLIQTVATEGMRVVEVGTYTGSTSLAMLPFIKQAKGKLFCVDWFRGTLDPSDRVTQISRQQNVLEIFLENVRKAGFEDYVTTLVGTSEALAPMFVDEMADLVFIDADHRYSSVVRDIENWYPKVKVGGILCGHDFERPASEVSLRRMLEHCEEDFVDDVHYGVIRAVSEFFPEVSQMATIWYVRKTNAALCTENERTRNLIRGYFQKADELSRKGRDREATTLREEVEAWVPALRLAGQEELVDPICREGQATKRCSSRVWPDAGFHAHSPRRSNLREEPSEEGPDNRSIPTWFESGNYAAVAMRGARDCWQTYAAYAMVGKSREALEGLRHFDHPDAQFYGAVAHWMAGEEDRAIPILEQLRSEYAQNLLRLIRKPKITVLSQLPWRRGFPQDLLTGGSRDPKFIVNNISFHPDDTQNRPYADVHHLYDPRKPPDFYVCQMVEWHVVPPNIQELPCPIFGQTADYDLHIQTVYPWLQLFDELVVTDGTEWEDVRRLVSIPVSTFPKSFGIPGYLPPIPRGPRHMDVYWSGTVQHPYHPDKAALLQYLMGDVDLNMLVVDGFVHPSAYFPLLGQSKVVFTYYRHSGGMVTRGLEALAMGCGVIVQKDNVLTLYADERHGVLTYESPQDLVHGIRRVVNEWPDFEQRAQLGAHRIRADLSLEKSGSQYLRYLTVLSAKPRPSRMALPDAQRSKLVQKRSVLCKGWLPDVPERQQGLVQANLERWMPELPRSQSSHHFIDIARELVLWAYYVSDLQDPTSLFTKSFELYRHGVGRFPHSLVLQVNFIRVALHFGQPQDVADAVEMARDILQTPLEKWVIDPLEDVFPYDFLSTSFDYRTYFDAVVRNLAVPRESRETLQRVLLASVHFHLGHYEQADEHFKQAAALNPEFPTYQLRYARVLVKQGSSESFQEAVKMLVPLVETSILAQEAFDVLDQLQQEGLVTVEEFPRLAALAGRMTRQLTTCRNVELPTDKSGIFPRLRPLPSKEALKNEAACQDLVADSRERQVTDASGRWVDSRPNVSPNPTPAISCLVVSHNKPERVHEAIRSIVDQQFPDWEAIIMDSGELYDQGYFDRFPWMQDSRIRILKSGETPELRREKAMAPWCWNECHRRGFVRGDLVVYLCDDDRWYPNAFQTFVEYFRNHPSSFAVYASQDVGLVLPDGQQVSLGERRATTVGGQCCGGRTLDCQVDYLQFCHRRVVLESFPTQEFWPEGLDTQTHADGIFMERVGRYVPIDPLDVKVGLNRRTPDSTYVPTDRVLAELKEKSHANVSAPQDSLSSSNGTSRRFACSIIIPLHNRVDLTKQCLQTLAAVTDEADYEVILVDNGSTDGTRDYVKTLGGDLQVIRNETNLGFARACNQGAQAARGRYLVFLNNDTIPHREWLGPLVRELESEADVGVVGSKLVYPNGRVQHAGIVVSRRDFLPYLIYRDVPEDIPCVSRRRECLAVTGACLGVKQELFERLGGFDEGYRNGLEDADFCLKVWEQGYRVVYQPLSVLTHLESQTVGRKDHDQANTNRFLERWRERVIEDEDMAYVAEGLYVHIVSARGGVRREVRTIASEDEKRKWERVANIQKLRWVERMPEAQSDFKDLEGWPQDPDVLSWAGELCRRIGWVQLAQAFWTRVLTLAEYPEAHVHLAKIALEQHQVSQAESQVRLLLDRHPHFGEGHLVHGIVAMQRREFAKALQSFSRAEECGADVRRSRMGIGMAAFGLGDLDRSWSAFFSLWQSRPDDQEVMKWVLQTGTACSKWDLLREALSRYCERNPADGDMRYALAGVHLRLNEVAESQAQLATLRVLMPEYEGLEALEEAIRQHAPREPVSNAMYAGEAV